MKIQNICSARKYEVDGQERTAWRTIGVLKTFNSGKQGIELYQQPDVYYGVFDQKDKDNMSQPSGTQKAVEEIDVDKQNLPF